jgi:hypothetical protein
VPDVPTVPLVVLPVALVVPAVVLDVALPRSISSIEAVNRAIAALSTLADAVVCCVVCAPVVGCVVCGFWALALPVEPLVPVEPVIVPEVPVVPDVAVVPDVPAVPVIVPVEPVVAVASGVSWLVVAGEVIERDAAAASSPPGALCAIAAAWN